jgi:threonyl-tRNA synthetase
VDGFFVDIDYSDNSLSKKVRNAQQGRYNYILVIGGRETESESVNVRANNGFEHGEMSTQALLTMLNDSVQAFA